MAQNPHLYILLTSETSHCFGKTSIIFTLAFSKMRKIIIIIKKIRHTLELKHEAVVTSIGQNIWYLLLMKEGSLCWKFIFEEPSLKNHQFCSAKLLIFIYLDPWRVLSIEQSCFNWNSNYYSPLLVSSTQK